MSKIFSCYENNVDKAWYNSSNVLYTECIDNDGELKTLKVVFKNGSQYQYNGVDVRDYLLLRESASQGKGLNRLIKEKKYEYVRLDDVDVDKLKDELERRSGDSVYVKMSDGNLTISDGKGNVLIEFHSISDETFKVVVMSLRAVGKNVIES